MTRYAYYDAGNDCIATLTEISDDYSHLDYYEVPDGANVNDLYIRDNALHVIPPRPNAYSVFDQALGLWVDPRTESDWTDANNAVRVKTSISRIEFVLYCKEANILTEDEGITAAKGEFPPAFAAIVATLPEEEQFEAAVRWAGATQIDRTMPLILSMATAIGVDEWLLDWIFDIVWPAPLPSWPPGQLHPIYQPAP